MQSRSVLKPTVSVDVGNGGILTATRREGPCHLVARNVVRRVCAEHEPDIFTEWLSRNAACERLTTDMSKDVLQSLPSVIDPGWSDHCNTLS